MAQNIEEFRNSIPVGDLGIIPLQSCSELGNMVNEYIVDWRKERESVLHQDDRVKGFLYCEYQVLPFRFRRSKRHNP